MAKHFLYLTNDRLLGLIWNNGEFVNRESFMVSDGASEIFRRYLVKHRETPAYLVVDLIEEDFRLDTMPHLRGTDAEAVQTRKLSQIYRSTVYRHAIVQGREVEGRRDDRVLFHAITNQDLLKPWIDMMELAEVPLEGIYSSPVSSSRLLDALALTHNNTLLVAIVPDSGLRQSYFQNKQMKFSRLTPLTTDGMESMAQQIASETSRTWQYLESLRFFTLDDRLEVCILAHLDDQKPITEEMKKFPFLRYRLLDIAEVANAIKLKHAPPQSSAEEILVQCYASGKLENHYAAPENRRYAIYRRTRTGLYAMTAILLAVGAFGALFFLQQANSITAEIEKRNTSQTQQQNEYQQVSNAVRNQSLNSESVRDTASFYVSQMRPLPAPGPLLRELSQVFSDFTDVSLSQITWETSSDPGFTPAYTPVGSKSPSTVRSEIKTDLATQAAGILLQRVTAKNPNDPNPPYPGNHVQIAIIEGAITPFDNNYRKALARVNQLISRMNGIKNIKASAISMPLDTQVNTTIKADMVPAKGATSEAPFVLRVQFESASKTPGNEQP